MPLFNEAEVWREIVSRAELGADEVYLRLVKPEFKRQALFLRTQNGLVLPEDVVARMERAAASMDYRLSVTGKWATMADMHLAVGEITWLWKHWIPMGMLTMLAGEPGTSKSSFALWLCKQVTEGGSFTDRTPVEAGPCIFVDTEAAQVITKQRCLDMHIRMDQVYVPNLGNDMLAQPDLNDASHREQLTAMVEEIRPRLIVIDSLGGAKSGGENRKEEMQPTMLYLTHLVQNRSCAMVIIHHLNKVRREEDEEITMNHMRGSSVVAQFARSILFLSKKPQGMQLRCGKSNLSVIPEPLRVRFIQEYPLNEEGSYDTVVRGFELEPWPEEVKITKFMEAENWIVKVLTQTEGNELAAREVFELGRDEPFTLPMLKAAAASLEKKGLITRTGGKYSVYRLVQQSLWDAPEES